VPSAVELGHLLEKKVVLHENWAPRAGSDRVLILSDGAAGGGCYVRGKTVDWLRLMCYGPKRKQHIRGSEGGNPV
jgi:hypothetical protein